MCLPGLRPCGERETEFAGLLQALKENESRIYLGITPDQLRLITENPTKYIRSLEIRKTADAVLTEPWFDGTSIELNPGLIAVIGNKGSGKSALVDILGLLGNTARGDDASFLTPKRFCEPVNNKARNFEADLQWESGDKEKRSWTRRYCRILSKL